MSWLAQVRHVFAKDVRQSWRLALAFLGVTLLAMGRALGWWLPAGEGAGAFGWLVLPLASLTAASVVQQDSPTRSDAFWGTLPLTPTAVLAAKMSYACVLLGIALVAHAAAMQSFHLDAARTAALLRAPIIVGSVALLLAMLVAAALADLRSWILTGIAVLPVISIGSYLLPEKRPGLEWFYMMVAALCIVGAVALLVWLYRGRDMRRRTRIACVLLPFVLVMAVADNRRQPRVQHADGTSEPAASMATIDGPRIPFSLRLFPGAELLDPQSDLSLMVVAAPAPDGMLASLALSRLTLTLRDGSSMDVSPQSPLLDFSTSWFDVIPPPADQPVRWLVPPRPDSQRTNLGATLDKRQLREIAKGVARVTIDGQVLLTEGRTVGDLPLIAGRTLVMNGRRIRVIAWDSDLKTPILSLQTSVLGGQAVPGRGVSQGEYEGFALVNPARREGIPLHHSGAQSGIETLVLPGTPFHATTSTWSPRVDDFARPGDPRPDSSWYHDARLVVTAPVVRSSYPVHLELAIPERAASATRP